MAEPNFTPQVRERLPDWVGNFDPVRMNQSQQIIERRFNSIENALVEIDFAAEGAGPFAPLEHTHELEDITDYPPGTPLTTDNFSALINLDDLGDVDTAGVLAGFVVKRNPTNDQWNAAPDAGGGGGSFNPVITAPQEGDVVQYISGQWENVAFEDVGYVAKTGDTMAGNLEFPTNVEATFDGANRIFYDGVDFFVGTTRPLVLAGGFINMRATTAGVTMQHLSIDTARTGVSTFEVWDGDSWEDVVLDTRTLDVDGTADEIDITPAGPLDLSADRLWTVKIADDVILPGVGAETVPIGTTAERPVSPVNGMFRYNSDIADFEGYANGDWRQGTRESGSGFVLEYSFSTTTTAGDPGPGFFRFDNAAIGSITNLYIDQFTGKGADAAKLLAQLENGDLLYIQQFDDASKSQFWEVTGPTVDNTGWYTVPISLIGGTLLPDNNAVCFVSLNYQANPDDFVPVSRTLEFDGTADQILFTPDTPQDLSTNRSWVAALVDDAIFPGNESVTLPDGTTAQEPTAVNGMLRYDTDTGKLRGVEGGAWVDLVAAGSLPTGTVTNSTLRWDGAAWLETADILFGNAANTNKIQATSAASNVNILANAPTGFDASLSVRENGAVKGRLQWDSSAANLFLDSLDLGAPFLLRGTNAGAVTRRFLQGDPDTLVEIFHPASDAVHLETNVDGIAIPTVGAMTMPVGTTAQEPTAANGMIRYDATTNKVRVVENGSWIDVGTGGNTFAGLDDTNIAAPAVGQTLTWDGTDWANTSDLTIFADGIRVLGTLGNSPASGGAQIAEIQLLNSASAIAGQLGFLNEFIDTGTLQIQNRVYDGSVQIAVTDGVGGERLSFVSSDLLGTILYDPGTNEARLTTTSDGIDVAGTNIELANSAATGTFLRVLNTSGGIDWRMAGGGNGIIQQLSAAGADEGNFIEFDRDGAVRLLHNDAIILETRTNGIEVRGSLNNDPALSGTQDARVILLNSGGTDAGRLAYLSSVDMTLDNFVHGGDVRIRSQNSAGATSLMLAADPDGAVDLNYNGGVRLSTTSSGATVIGALFDVDRTISASAASVLVRNSEGGFRLDADNQDLEFYQTTSTGTLSKTWAKFFNDARVALYYNDTERFQTSDTGAKVLGLLSIGDKSELTISAGAVTATTGYHDIDTEADAATDDLDTITFAGLTGSILVIAAESSSRTIVCKDSTGNMELAGDFSMTHAFDTLTMIWSGTSWRELSRSDNAA